MNSPSEYPLAWARKAQFLVAGLSLPCAIAAIVLRNGSAETILQLILFIIAMFASAVKLFLNRGPRKHTYSSLEILADAFMVAQFLGIYIAGIVILAKRNYGRYWRHSEAQSIPHTYSNLSCLIMLISYGYTFTTAVYHRHHQYLLRLLKGPWGTTYVLCPSCDRDVQALDGKTPRWQAGAPERTANSFDDARGLYTDFVAEDQSLLRDEVNETTKQETGVISSTNDAV
ncbi:hypothetical protein N7478_000596 [Penicillium angulare]|uniref:uncharacterized protein n=1 Tax=Penicillium angulare TaxID=116970 RepID=UPI00254131F9|nr:uncharacterized protein N7478_000596 [Penicillium angulare]KAJ5291345.1 hypothetical protein N7478_000596 [Penicillium angulare]